MKRFAFLTLAAMSLAWPSLSRAEVIIYIYEDGNGNVVASGGGTLNTTALTLNDGGPGSAYVDATIGGVRVGTGTSYMFDVHTGGPSGAFGTGGLNFATSTSGQIFGINDAGTQLYTPDGYVSGHSLSGSATFASQTYVSLGLTDGTYTYSWGNGATADDLKVEIGTVDPNAVPEPTSMAMVLSAAAIGLGARSWSRRRAARG